MLKKIEICNFFSFKGTTTIDFTKTNYKFYEDTHTKNDIVKGAVFVGANASGKSNVLRAIKTISAMLMTEDFFNKYVELFKSLLTDETFFYVKGNFLINGSDVEYYVKYDFESKIIKETLHIDGKQVLSRLGDNAEITLEQGKEEFFDKENVVSDILFLRTHYYNTKFNNNEIIGLFMRKVSLLIYIDQLNGNYAGLTSKQTDIIKDFNQDKVNIINDFLEHINYNFRISVKKNNVTNESVCFFNRIGTNFDLPLEFESSGNQVLIKTILPLVYAIQNNAILIIDEFSSGFHNELEETLIKFFMENTNEGQLFISTHSTNILSNKLLRPDQMFAVDYSVEKGTTVKRFSDEQPRLSQNTEKMYESGVFGGLPRYDRD